MLELGVAAAYLRSFFMKKSSVLIPLLMVVLCSVGISGCQEKCMHGNNPEECFSCGSFRKYKEQRDRIMGIHRKKVLDGLSSSEKKETPTAQSSRREKMVSCPQCYGTGRWHIDPVDPIAYVQCSVCGGSGKMKEQDAQVYMQAAIQLQQMYGNGGSGYSSYGGGQSSSSRELACVNCHGSGRCNMCAGKGWKTYNGYNQDCVTCRGTGTCQTCYGTGRL